jgi:hypothetical protein
VPYRRGRIQAPWGYYPGGGIGLILIIVVVLILVGRISDDSTGSCVGEGAAIVVIFVSAFPAFAPRARPAATQAQWDNASALAVVPKSRAIPPRVFVDANTRN